MASRSSFVTKSNHAGRSEPVDTEKQLEVGQDIAASNGRESEERLIQIFISNQVLNILCLQVHPSTTISNLKELIQEKLNIQAKNQRIVTKRGIELCDTQSLMVLGIQQDTNLEIRQVAGLMGGTRKWKSGRGKQSQKAKTQDEHKNENSSESKQEDLSESMGTSSAIAGIPGTSTSVLQSQRTSPGPGAIPKNKRETEEQMKPQAQEELVTEQSASIEKQDHLVKSQGTYTGTGAIPKNSRGRKEPMKLQSQENPKPHQSASVHLPEEPKPHQSVSSAAGNINEITSNGSVTVMASNIDPDQPVPSCPACDAKDPIVPHLDPLDTQDLSITLPSSRKTISFTDATRTYLKDHFPDLDKTTYRVPATLVYDRKGVLDLSTNEEVLSNETLGTARVSAKRAADEVVKDRFQKDAVEKVVQCFHSWGSEHGEGLLVLSEYNMQDYLRRAAKTGSKNRKTIDGEHDVMVIHLNTGVTFVQVKSVRNTKIKTKRERIEKAFKQIAKDEKAFRELNGDLVFIKRVPVVGFVALPELKRDHLSNTGLCDAHKGRVLTMEDLESTTEFNQWVENHLSNKQFKRRGTPSLGLENYIELCGRYVGLASVVQIRTLPEAVKKTSAMVGQILLTREQEEVIRAGNRLQVILGEYGTGKSLVLAKMAEKIVASGEGLDIVFVVSCTSVNQSMPTGKSNTRKPGSLLSSPSHLVSHFRSLFSEPMSPSFSIMSIRDLFQYCFPENANWNCECLSPVMMAKLTRKVISMHPKASVHMMWDEVPFISGWDWKPLKDLGKENPGTFMWVTIATGTYNTMISGEPVAYAKDKFRPNFEVLSLKKCMRMTRNGFRFYQALQTFLGNKGCCSTTSGNAVNGVVPRWYPLKNCFCESPCPLSSTCLHNRLTRTLKRIWRLLKNIDPSSVSFVCGDIDDRVNLALINAVKKACETLKIPADDLPTSDNDNQSTPETSENVASKPKKCNIVDSVSYRGCESPVVIIVSLRGTPFMMEFKGERHGWDDISPLISRALGQIIIITWSQRDIDQINSIFYSDMILSNRSSFPLPGSDERTEFLKTMIGKLDEILKVYSKKDGADYNSDSMLSSLETTTDEEELKEKVNKIVKTLGQQTHFLECLVKQNVIVKYGSPNINMSCCSL